MTGGPSDVVFGSTGDLEATRWVVAEALGVALKRHDSLYLGGDYYLGHLSGGKEVRIRLNLDLIENVPEISGWPGPVFVEVVASDPEGVTRQLVNAGLTPVSRDR